MRTNIEKNDDTMDNTNNWNIYIVQCNDDTLYTGISCDVKRRIHEHNHLKCAARYTRVRRPVKLVYQEQTTSRSAAAQREYQIKKMKTTEKKALIKSWDGTSQAVTPTA